MLFGLLCSAFHGREGENKKKKVQKTAFWVGNSHCFSIPGNRSRERQVTHYCVMHAFEHTVCWRGQEGEKTCENCVLGGEFSFVFNPGKQVPGAPSDALLRYACVSAHCVLERQRGRKNVQKTAFWVRNFHFFSMPGNRSREGQVAHY